MDMTPLRSNEITLQPTMVDTSSTHEAVERPAAQLLASTQQCERIGAHQAVRFMWSASTMSCFMLLLALQMVTSRGFLIGAGASETLRTVLGVIFLMLNTAVWVTVHLHKAGDVMSRRRYDGSWLFVRSSSVYLFHGSFVWVQIVLASSTFQPELSVREGLTEKSLKFLSYDVVAFQAMAMYFVGCVGGLWTETDEHRAHREQRLDEAEQRVEGTRALVVTIMSWEVKTRNRAPMLRKCLATAVVTSAYSFAFAVARGVWSACFIAWPAWLVFWMAISWYFQLLHERYACIERWFAALNATLEERDSKARSLPCQITSPQVWFEAWRHIVDMANLEYIRCGRAVAINLIQMTFCVFLVVIHTMQAGAPIISMATIFENDTCYYVIMIESVFTLCAGTLFALMPCVGIVHHLRMSPALLKDAFSLQLISISADSADEQGLLRDWTATRRMEKAMFEYLSSPTTEFRRVPNVLGLRVTPIVFRIVGTYALSGLTYVALALSQVISAHVPQNKVLRPAP